MPVASRWVRARILTCGVGLGLVGLWVGRGAYNLQIRDAEHLAEMAEDNFLRDIQIPPRRGRILDRNRRELATTVEVDSVACNPRVRGCFAKV